MVFLCDNLVPQTKARVAAGVDARVAAGVDLLDRFAPGWHDAIDVKALQISDGECCVLGQLFGEYGDGINFLHACRLDAGEDGFDDTVLAVECGFDSGCGVSYRMLTFEWRRVINARRTPAPPKRQDLVLVS